MVTSDTKKTVWVDMDGTIVDFDGYAIENIPLNERKVRTRFYVEQDYAEPYRTSIRETYSAPGFFKDLELYPGVIEGWQALIDAGYHPRILSSPLFSNPSSAAEKTISLERHLVPHFGRRVVEEAVFDGKKWKYPGLALIDDRPDAVRDGARAPWVHVLYGWPHRESLDGTTASLRMHDWSQVDGLIRSLDQIRHNDGAR